MEHTDAADTNRSPRRASASAASVLSVAWAVDASTKKPLMNSGFDENGAGDATRTRDVHLGKVVLYQLSYARKAGCKE